MLDQQFDPESPAEGRSGRFIPIRFLAKSVVEVERAKLRTGREPGEPESQSAGIGSPGKQQHPCAAGRDQTGSLDGLDERTRSR
jgi:hypothetical protein